MEEENRIQMLRPYIEMLSFWGESIEDFLFVWDVKEKKVYFAADLWEKYPLPMEEYFYTTEQLLTVVDSRDRRKMWQAGDAIVKGKKEGLSVECRIVDREQNCHWIYCSGKCVMYEDDSPSILVGSLSENAVSKKVDILTGLMNQVVLEENLKELLQKGECGYLMLIGIDDFKNVNDKHGRNYGNTHLKKLADILEKSLGYTEESYRLDGDKFGVLLKEYTADGVKAFYDSINVFFGKETDCTLSAGAVCYPEDSEEYSILYQYAESALNHVKRNGKNSLSIFSLEEYQERLFFLDLQEELFESVKQKFEGFHIFYQPVVNNETGALVKAEALLRWTSKKYGEIGPVVFIPILERTGLILEIGQWVLEQAMEQCKKWRKEIPQFKMNINLSYIQLKDEKIVEAIFGVLEKVGISGNAMILEVTESIQLQDYPYFNKLFYQLSKRGIQISIDDFGTGYSSLGYLKELNVDEIKIDKCFVRKIQNGAYNSRLVKSMIDLAHSVGIHVCVEGVETLEERMVLRRLQPDVIQGFYFGRPENPKYFIEKFITKAKAGEPIVQDAEQRQDKKTKKSLVQYAENYRNLLDALDDVIYVCDLQTKELYYVNKKGKKMTGIYEYAGKKCYELLGKRESPCIECTQKTMPQRGTFQIKTPVEMIDETIFLKKEKQILWNGKPARLEIAVEVGETANRIQ